MKRVTKLLITLAGIAAALAIALGGRAALAQAPDPTQTPTPQQKAPGGLRGWFGFGLHGPHGGFGNYDELLAQALGITVDQLTAAQAKARSAAIDQAVAQGAITQEQADLLKARLALQEFIDQKKILADALGMSVNELNAALAQGQRLPEIITARGLDPATVRDAIQKGYQDAVQQAVNQGVITQEQADQLQNDLGFHGFGGRHGFGRHGFPGWRGGAPTPRATPTPGSSA
ncbi:MAG: hypothetical protein M5U01_42430 [Ardenticatenaceae bacterium]|nr:hypothetical protein [Ardenticatenaceae bacterium]HBY95425.1 hypothetical protein [Chloroflexota bacterium]